MNLSQSKIRAAIAAAVLFCAGAAFGQDSEPAASQPAYTPVQLTIPPQPLARPDLEFKLFPGVEDMEHSNAALHYHLAIELMSKPNPGLTSWMGIDNYDDAVDAQMNVPLEKMDEALAQKIVDMQKSSLHELSHGARCEMIDWDASLRQDGMMAMLPYLGNLRQLSRILTISIRLDIKNHRWKDAQEKLQTGYALARQLGQGDTLIDALVGLAIGELMNKTLQDWVRDPQAPNLYWPLVNMPRPFDDLYHPLAYERSFAYFSFPALKDMRDGKYSNQTWFDLINSFHALGPVMGDPLNAFDSYNELSRETLGTGAAIILYPEAKKFLMARGVSPADVEKMPAATTLGKYFYRSYEEAADADNKWNGVPIYQTDPEDKQMEALKADPEINILAKILIPSLHRARFLSASMDRNIDMLRIVEALRDYAARNHALPDSLDAIGLPMPTDSTTGKPFIYEHHGDSATLSSLPPDPWVGPRATEAIFEITLARQ